MPKRKRSSKRVKAQRAGYRSALEFDVAANAKRDGIKLEYEPKDAIIGWIPKPKKYLPDFRLKNGIIIEVKGRLTVFDRVKHLSVKEQHPEIDIRFVFQFDNKLTRTSKTRYSDWAKKHGFQYAFGEIPKEWNDE
jgi:hypothetical protein